MELVKVDGKDFYYERNGYSINGHPKYIIYYKASNGNLCAVNVPNMGFSTVSAYIKNELIPALKKS